MPEGIENLVRINMKAFGAYSPCKSPEVVARILGFPVDYILKLDANENPYGCSPRVKKALEAYPYFNIYPDAAQTEVRQLLSNYTGIGPEYLVAGAGADELIDLLLRLFIEPGDEVITAVPTFDMYRFCTQVCCGKLVAVIRRDDFSADVPAIKAAITPRTKIIFLANPNNPTGTMVPLNDILELMDTGLPIVMDETYYEFSRETVAPRVLENNNLIVLRSFSKWAGLAGLRVGYGIFPARIAEYLLKIKPPYNINLAAQVAVKESLADSEYLLGTVDQMIAEREKLFTELCRIPYLKPVPSKANFILCKVTQGQANLIQEGMEKKGILVRYYDTPLLKNYIRISAGKPEHTPRIMKAFRELEDKING
jgi:histidinol-phosphate aminotransferase